MTKMSRSDWMEYERRRRNYEGSASRDEREYRPENDRAGGTYPIEPSQPDSDRERVPNRDYYDGVGR